LLKNIKGPTQVVGEAHAHECSKTSSQKSENYRKSSPSSTPVAVTPAADGDGDTTQGAQERPPGKKKEK
jgi:hypothetical protein